MTGDDLLLDDRLLLCDHALTHHRYLDRFAFATLATCGLTAAGDALDHDPLLGNRYFQCLSMLGNTLAELDFTGALLHVDRP